MREQDDLLCFLLQEIAYRGQRFLDAIEIPDLSVLVDRNVVIDSEQNSFSLPIKVREV